MNPKRCCTPSSGRPPAEQAVPSLTCSDTELPEVAVSEIPATQAILGTDRPIIHLDEEGPGRIKSIKRFWIMQTAVTNTMFERFVEDTGYISDAERFGWSFVFHLFLPDGSRQAPALPENPWWLRVDGAHWRLINGPGSESSWHGDHPVVHVTWNDAMAFANWAGGRLPTEVEWEHAARGGLGDVPFPWGELEPDDRSFQPCNIWQGRYPHHNAKLDGYAATAPARSFSTNGYGLYNMCGNVWEWNAQSFKIRGKGKQSRQLAEMMKGTKILKGGSFLCHRSYCYRYRISARTGSTEDSSTAHQGFRLVFDEPPAIR